jgi:hypothetical protein
LLPFSLLPFGPQTADEKGEEIEIKQEEEILSFSFLSFILHWELNPTPHPAVSSIAILDYDIG